MEKEETITEENIEVNIEKFFNERKDAFVQTSEKAIFLVGVLINYLLYVQRDERRVKWGEEPFRSKLYGLFLDETKIKKLFEKAVGKLSEYKRTYPALEKIVAKYLSESGKTWKMSKEEISYYFTLGLILGSMFKVKKEENERGGKKNE